MITVFVERERLSVPNWVTDIDTFRQWVDSEDVPESARVWFLFGEVWAEMTKEQLYTHNAVRTEITHVLYGLAKAEKTGRVFSDGALLTNRTANLSGNPDVVFVSHDTFKSGRVKQIAGREGGLVELEGVPDLVVEVVSDSSEKKDNQTLFEAYFEAGIPEYWLVDARGKQIEFAIYKHTAKKYTASRTQPGGWVKSPVFGKAFRLVRGTDESGNPEFTLEVK